MMYIKRLSCQYNLNKKKDRQKPLILFAILSAKVASIFCIFIVNLCAKCARDNVVFMNKRSQAKVYTVYFGISSV